MADALTRGTSIKHFHSINNNKSSFKKYYKKYINIEFIKYLIFDPAAVPTISIVILLAELVLNILIIQRVPYTEIDWKAYMQECDGFLNGTTNYALLKGDTGPLVYPAGFIYIYSVLYYVTSGGRNIRLAQYIFCLMYLLQMFLVLRLYGKSRKVPPYVLLISAFTSYRVHSIYVLRLFNDPVAIVFLYIALNLFVDASWTWGSIFYSCGVACKMNILLCAPALLLFYLINLGLQRTILQLCICASIQLILGLPFLITHPIQYINGSFNFGRIFEHKWTVNYRFLSVELFQSTLFHAILIIMNALLLLIFLKPTKRFFTNYVRLRELQRQLQPQLDQENLQQQRKQKQKQKHKKRIKHERFNRFENEKNLTREQEEFLKSFERSLQQSNQTTNQLKQPTKYIEKQPNDKVSIYFDKCSQLMLLPFFLCNFIGVMCARSLHYQFYVWYFHSLPYLTWSTNYSLGLRFLILGLIEYSWNTYPSTNLSSILLHICHLVLLIGVGYTMFKTVYQSQHIQQQQKINTPSHYDMIANKIKSI